MSMFRRLLLGAACVALAGLAGACSDGDTQVGLRCGDNICFGDETAENCSRDCSFACVPDEARCEGNVVATCAEDGLHETIAACETGEVCQSGVCVESSGLVPDTGAPDASSDSGSADGGDAGDVGEGTGDAS